MVRMRVRKAVLGWGRKGVVEEKEGVVADELEELKRFDWWLVGERVVEGRKVGVVE